MTDAELIEFASEFRDGILDGRESHSMCAAVCWPLAGMLNMIGIECREMESDFGDYNHVWIQLADGRILDPTCDQFNDRLGLNLPVVYLGEPIPQVH